MDPFLPPDRCNARFVSATAFVAGKAARVARDYRFDARGNQIPDQYLIRWENYANNIERVSGQIHPVERCMECDPPGSGRINGNLACIGCNGFCYRLA